MDSIVQYSSGCEATPLFGVVVFLLVALAVATVISSISLLIVVVSYEMRGG